MPTTCSRSLTNAAQADRALTGSFQRLKGMMGMPGDPATLMLFHRALRKADAELVFPPVFCSACRA